MIKNIEKVCDEIIIPKIKKIENRKNRKNSNFYRDSKQQDNVDLSKIK